MPGNTNNPQLNSGFKDKKKKPKTKNLTTKDKLNLLMQVPFVTHSKILSFPQFPCFGFTDTQMRRFPIISEKKIFFSF